MPSAGCAKMKTTLSSWTPLNHPLSNRKVFEERRKLLANWFDRWSDSQRRLVLQDLVLSCSLEQLMFLSSSVSRRLPLQAADFTCLLPRALSLYIFSFLDPRSLCRCAGVSWHWKSLVELDQLWLPKCVKLGWCLSFPPTPYEQGVWKRLYIHTVQELRAASQQTSLFQQQHVVVPHVSVLGRGHGDPSELACDSKELPESSSQQVRSICRKKLPAAPPPWRDADRHPKDTLRFNYLDNTDPSEKVLTGQMNTRSTCRTNMWKQDAGRKKSISETNYKLRKAKSLMFLTSNSRPQPPPPTPTPPAPSASPAPPHELETRPSWAAHTHQHFTENTAKSMVRLAQWNAGIRPGPVRTAVPVLSVAVLRASQRSHRSAPSTPLFQT